MPRFLIEVPHEAKVGACVRAAETFIRTGSHFLTRAEWGCMDGDHRAWLILELGDKDEALNVIPPLFRAHAKIVQLNTFTLAQLEELQRHHQG
jgi:hypothetical protein